jgi:hypothetical protein
MIKSLLSLLLSFVAMAFVFSATGQQQPKYEFKQKDIPEPLKAISFDLPITCTAQKVAVAGYGIDGFPKGFAGINDPNSQKGLYEDVHVLIDSEPTIWKITVHGDKADVILSGWSGITTETWAVISKTDEYLILVRTDLGKQIRTITINARYATFVHCFNGELAFVNHGAIFWGTCSN